MPDQSQHLTRRQRQKRQKLLLFGGGAGVLLLLAFGAIYWFVIKDTKPKLQPANVTPSSQKQPAAQTSAADPTPVSYKSAKLNIELTHRKDWALKESATGQITVTSPQISYADVNGQSKTGVFTVKIRKGVPDNLKTVIEKAVAPRDSEVIAYAAPTENQRQYTNLSYAGQKDVFSFFIVTGNTDLKAGIAYAYRLNLDGEFYLIVGGYGADKTDSLAFDSVPKEAMDSDTLEQAIKIVESLKIY